MVSAWSFSVCSVVALLTSISTALQLLAVPGGNVQENRQGNETGRTANTEPPINIKAYYVNLKGSRMRRTCMEEQLARHQSTLAAMGINLQFEHFPAVVLKTCQNVKECMKERPDCFPSRKAGKLYHPVLEGNEDDVQMMRGVIGNWCAHLKNLDVMDKAAARFDYFMVFEDDVVLLDNFPESLQKLITRVPPLWTLTAFDTFDNYFVPSQVHEDLMDTGRLPLMSISATKGQYWGGHAWLLSAKRIHMFKKWYNELPAIPLDWVPKAPSPLHLGMLAYSPRAAIQKRFLTEKEASSLSEACGSVSTSDIRASKLLSDRPTKSVDAVVSTMKNRSGSTLASPRELIVFGMYDTGTNMLMHMIRNNLEAPNRVELCKNYSGWAYCGAVWKHTHPSRLSEFPHRFASFRPEGAKDFKAAVAVIMIRHPFSLMRSIQYASYDMKCGSVGDRNWLRRPCRYVEPTGKALEQQKGMPRLERATCPTRDHTVTCWQSVVSAWNSYTEGYLKHMSGLFHDTIIVRYEDMLENPVEVLKQIARRVGVQAPRTVDVPFEGTKVVNGERSSGLTGALEKLHAKAYDSNFTDAELKDLCARLDKPLLFSMGYHGCQVENASFVDVTAHLPGRKGTRGASDSEDDILSAWKSL